MSTSKEGGAVLTSIQSKGPEPGSQEEAVAMLYQVYNDAIKPVEDMYNYQGIDPQPFADSVKNERPFVTFFGPWSSGKSTFINYLLQENHLWTGQHPTTSEFTVVMYGDEARTVDGPALVNAKNLPFSGLNRFGDAFINSFKGFQAPHPFLKRISMIDTPGVLESSADVHTRKYDYVGVCQWFAQRSDIIYFLFDPTKLDAGPELQAMFKNALKGCESKVRIVLNKADSISSQELYSVYGSLFWNLSSFITSTEPPRVYVGSFWDQPYKEGTFSLLFSEEKADLISELTEVLPQHSRDKKVNTVLQRARRVHAHAMVVGELKAGLPTVFGRSKAKKKAVDDLPKTYEKLSGELNMNKADFPDKSRYVDFFENNDVESFNSRATAEKSGRIKKLRDVINNTLPNMLHPIKRPKQSNVRDKAETKLINDLYAGKIQAQFDGQKGVQGSADLTSRRTSVLPTAQRGTLQPIAPFETQTLTSEVPYRASDPVFPVLHNSSPYHTESEDGAAASEESNAQMLAMMQQLMAQQQEQQRQNRELNEKQQREFEEKLQRLQQHNEQLTAQQQELLQQRLLEMNQQQAEERRLLAIAAYNGNNSNDDNSKENRSKVTTPPSTIFVEPPPGVFNPEDPEDKKPVEADTTLPEAIDTEEEPLPESTSQAYAPSILSNEESSVAHSRASKKKKWW